MIEYDLHVHSSYSDGVFSPEEIIKLALEKQLKGLSLTDHDTINGLEECQILSEKYNLDFIPGIELGTYDGDNEIHILGYYIDYKDDYFKKYLEEFQNARFNRVKKMIDKINTLGYDITLQDVLNISGEGNKSIGRPHVARALISKGYFNDISEVFERLIGNDKPAYVERYKLSIKEGIELIKRVNGISILAHPALLKHNSRGKKFESFLEELKGYGLDGIEVYHSKQSESDSIYYHSIANKHEMIITGGSDCHGIYTENGYLLGRKGISEYYASKLKRLKGIIK